MMALHPVFEGICAAHGLTATRYCKACGLGPREWMECEEPDCDIETQAEANARQGAESRP